MSMQPSTASLVGRLSLGALTLMLMSGPAFAAGSPFVQGASSRPFDQTLAALKRAVSSNGMMVMGHLDQQKVLAMTGLNLAGAQSFFIGNPMVGKKLFGMNPAVGAVVPLRVYVWEANGESHVGYFRPSTLLSEIHPGLGMGGAMLDRKFAMILHESL